MELVLHLRGKHVPVGTHVLLEVVGHGHHEVAVAGDGIVEFAAMELCQRDALVAFHRLEDEACEQFDGVGALLVDVVARVPAYESLQ